MLRPAISENRAGLGGATYDKRIGPTLDAERDRSLLGEIRATPSILADKSRLEIGEAKIIRPPIFASPDHSCCRSKSCSLA